MINTTGDLVSGGDRRVRGRMCSHRRINSPLDMLRTCSSMRRNRVIMHHVLLLGRDRRLTGSGFTVLCHAGTRSHIFRRILHGGNIPCHVCNNLSFCRHGRIGSIVTCFHVTIGPRSRRTFGHVVGCPTENVNSAAINGILSTTSSCKIDL